MVYAEAASARLSPIPLLKSADRLAWAGTVCGVVGAVLLWTGAIVREAASWPALALASLCFCYAIACYGWAGARRASVVRVRRGMPRALAVWRAAWYCERCDGVFFTAGALPVGTVPGQLMSAGQLLSVAEFQHLVWAVGGYDSPGGIGGHGGHGGHGGVGGIDQKAS